MPAIWLPVIALAAALVCLRGPIKWAATVLVVAPFVVPDAVPITSGVHSVTLLRLLVLASAAGLIMRGSAREIPWRTLKPGRVHFALLGFVLVSYLVGVSWAPWPADFHASFNDWLFFVDYLLLLWCVIAYARGLGARWLANVLVSAVAFVAVIGLMEKLTGGSYAHWIYERLNVFGASSSFGGPLELRGGSSGAVRVRAAEQFALEYAWVLTILVPLSLSIALTAKRKLARLVPPLLVLVIVLTITRSAFAGLAFGGALWVVLSKFDKRTLMLAALAGVAAFGLYVGVPSLHHPYQSALADSLQSRIIREDYVTTTVEHHVVTGLGFSGLDARGVTSTDSTIVQTYGDLGVIGLVGLATILLIPAAVAAVGALGSQHRDRFLAAAATAGLGAAAVGLVTFDGLSISGFAWPMWLVASLGVVSAEELLPRRRRRRVSPARALLPIGGVAVGLVLTLAVTPRATTISNFHALADSDLTATSGDNGYLGVIAVDTVCTAGTGALGAVHPHVFCRGTAGIGQGYLQISGPSPAAVAGELAVWDQAAAAVDSAYLRVPAQTFNDKSTPIRTAPLYLGLAGLLLALFVPTLPWPMWSTGRGR